MAEEHYELCMFPDLWDNSNSFSVVDQFSIVTSSRIGVLPQGVNIQNSRFISPGMISDTPNLSLM